MPYLRYPARGVEQFQQELTTAMVIGRAPSCDLCLPDVAVSRQHCRLEPDGDRWLAIDLDSRNGTYINGRRIQRQHLNDGDRLQVGDTVMTFTQNASAGSRPATPRDALLLARVDNEVSHELSSSTVSGARILPTPRPRKPGLPTTAAPSNAGRPAARSSAVFNRPPARPMVRPGTVPADAEE